MLKNVSVKQGSNQSCYISGWNCLKQLQISLELSKTITNQVAAEKGRTMGNAVGCPTEWAEEMEESSFFRIILIISMIWYQ